jgi:hypothetical protein
LTNYLPFLAGLDAAMEDPRENLFLILNLELDRPENASMPLAAAMKEPSSIGCP